MTRPGRAVNSSLQRPMPDSVGPTRLSFRHRGGLPSRTDPAAHEAGRGRFGPDRAGGRVSRPSQQRLETVAAERDRRLAGPLRVIRTGDLAVAVDSRPDDLVGVVGHLIQGGGPPSSREESQIPLTIRTGLRPVRRECSASGPRRKHKRVGWGGSRHEWRVSVCVVLATGSRPSLFAETTRNQPCKPRQAHVLARWGARNPSPDAGAMSWTPAIKLGVSPTVRINPRRRSNATCAVRAR